MSTYLRCDYAKCPNPLSTGATKNAPEVLYQVVTMAHDEGQPTMGPSKHYHWECLRAWVTG